MDILELIKDKNILIVGGSSSASKKSEEWYNSFDVIVRCNNYKKANNSRTDIFYSYFGKNIKKTPEELKQDGVKLLISRCPNADMSEQLSSNKIDMVDYRWIYKLRKDWWFCDLYIMTVDEMLEQINSVGTHMPTTGLSAILFFVKRQCNVEIIGFDCFDTNIHNLNEIWDNSGNHNLSREKEVLTQLDKENKINWNK